GGIVARDATLVGGDAGHDDAGADCWAGSQSHGRRRAAIVGQRLQANVGVGRRHQAGERQVGGAVRAVAGIQTVDDDVGIVGRAGGGVASVGNVIAVDLLSDEVVGAAAGLGEDGVAEGHGGAHGRPVSEVVAIGEIVEGAAVRLAGAAAGAEAAGGHGI